MGEEAEPALHPADGLDRNGLLASRNGKTALPVLVGQFLHHSVQVGLFFLLGELAEGGAEGIVLKVGLWAGICFIVLLRRLEGRRGFYAAQELVEAGREHDLLFHGVVLVLGGGESFLVEGAGGHGECIDYKCVPVNFIRPIPLESSNMEGNGV